MLERVSAALRDRYEVLEEIGQGGMAFVYRARDIRHGREVALKVMKSEFADSLGAERFLQEIGYVARLNHPTIVPLFDSGEADGVLYYSMPFLGGADLKALIAEKGQFPVAEALQIAIDVCEALGHAHGKGLIHRDVKPSNIVMSGGHPLLMDFGIARAEQDPGLTATGVALGTPQYMAPEQSARDPVDERTDIYALGCVLYELLVGAPPFHGRTAISIQARHVADPPPPIRTVRPGVPEDVEAAVLKALEKAPADRFQTVADFRIDLEAALGAHRSPRPAQVARPGSSRLRRVGAVAATAAIGLLGWWLGTMGGAPVGTDAIASVAVLAFDDLTSVDGSDYLGDGIAEELIMGLSGVEGLKVAARTSAFAFKTRDAVLSEIGELLGVSTVLEGSVRRDGDSLQIAVRLLRTRDEEQLWTASHQTTLGGVADVQDLVALAVLEELGVELEEGQARLMTPGTASAEAYDAYLRARHLLSRRLEATNSVPLFQQAIAADSGYAPAYAGLAHAYTMMGLYAFARPDSVLPLAVDAVDRALALAPQNYEALATSGLIDIIWHWDWEGADRDLAAAVAQAPRSPEARGWYAYHALLTRYDTDTALEHAMVALDSDPLAYTARMVVGQILTMQGRVDEAIALLEEGIRLAPESEAVMASALATAYGEAGDWDRAIAIWEPITAATGRRTLSLAVLATFNARGGRTDDATALIEEVLLRSRREQVTALNLAHPLAALGRHDEAFDWLEESVRRKEATFINLTLFTELRDLSEHPRYQALRRQAGLAPLPATAN